MTNGRINFQPMPDAPESWDRSSKESWRQLIRVLEASNLFDKARRTRTQFVVKGTVSVPVTLDMTNPTVTVVTHVLGHLLVALQSSPYLDIRTTVA